MVLLHTRRRTAFVNEARIVIVKDHREIARSCETHARDVNAGVGSANLRLRFTAFVSSPMLRVKTWALTPSGRCAQPPGLAGATRRPP